MFDRILLWRHLVPGFCFWGDFLSQLSISVLVIWLFIIPISSWFSIGRLNFSLSILLLDSLLFIIVTYTPLYFCIICCNLSFFISNIVDLILLFFLISLAQGLSILFIVSKKQLLVLLIFTIVSFLFHLFLLGSLWFISFY